MKYIEATIYTSIYGIEPVTELLDSMDVTGVVIENPEDVDQLMEKKNSYDWDYVDPLFCFLIFNSNKIFR